jgi:hypothetical protein
MSEKKKSNAAQRNRHDKLSCQQRLGYIRAPNEFQVPIMMEDGTLIWQGDDGPLPGSGDEMEKKAHRQALSLDETRRLQVGIFGFCVAESPHEP